MDLSNYYAYQQAKGRNGGLNYIVKIGLVLDTVSTFDKFLKVSEEIYPCVLNMQ